MPHSCIDSKAKVRMSDGSLKPIQSLQIGDRVKTLNKRSQLIDTTIIMFMDTSDEKSFFIKISTRSNRSIKVSHSHLVAVTGGGGGGGGFKWASQLRIGDLMQIYDYSRGQFIQDEVKSIEFELVDGFSAPLTSEGTILVEDILVSCYAVIRSHRVAHLAMSPIRWFYALNNYEYAPSYFKYMTQLNKQSKGYHWFAQLLYSFVYHSNLIDLL